MTLQQAAQAVIDRWDSPKWKDEPPTAVVIGALRKALADEQAQSVEQESVAWLVLDEDRVPIMCAPAKQMCNDHINDAINDFDIAEASKWVVREAFAHPAPPPAGDLASLISRAEASVTALNSRITEPFYCSLDQDAARVLSDCIDMLEADAGWEQVARAQDAKLHAMVGNPGGIEKLREVLDKARAQQVAVPLGLALVPIEPTPEMIAAARDLVVHDTAYHGYRSVYKAMLAAAQGAKQ